jgi:hypothetical protein
MNEALYSLHLERKGNAHGKFTSSSLVLSRLVEPKSTNYNLSNNSLDKLRVSEQVSGSLLNST